MPAMPAMSRRLRLASLLAVAPLASCLVAARARAQEGGGDAALAHAVESAHVSLARGLSAASARGKPISGKYEVDDGKPQLSVYTARGAHYWEVIVDHGTGRIAKAEEIKAGEDLTAAKAQEAVMAKAKRSLGAAVTRALRANEGYRAVSAIPATENGHAVATIRLVKGTSFKSLAERLD